ncbi:MAG TPA: response regulator [Phycisphaerales bacterium]|nr:response regulator [Phycisphaerales bacterium]
MDGLKPVTILLVEDDRGDQKLIKRSLTDQKIANDVFIAESAENALEYLQRTKNDDGQCPRPELILLDLNMPGMGGKEFLRRIKADADFDTIPVVILTTSNSEKDVLESYKLQAAGYVNKPVSMEGFKEIMNELCEYWFVICKRVSESQLACAKS